MDALTAPISTLPAQDDDTPVFWGMMDDARSPRGLRARKANGRFTTLRLPEGV